MKIIIHLLVVEAQQSSVCVRWGRRYEICIHEMQLLSTTMKGEEGERAQTERERGELFRNSAAAGDLGLPSSCDTFSAKVPLRREVVPRNRA